MISCKKEYSYRELFQQIAASATQFTEDFSITVPKGKYFVMGRQSSDFKRDSRSFGVVDADQMQGKVILRYWPLSEISLLLKHSKSILAQERVFTRNMQECFFKRPKLLAQSRKKNIVQTAIAAEEAMKMILIGRGWTNFRASLEKA